MDEVNYHNKMMEHITCGSYKVIDEDPRNKLMCLVSTLIKCLSIHESIKKKVTPNNDIMPQIYGVPKIHKCVSP
jgi:hypothetical protein